MIKTKINKKKYIEVNKHFCIFPYPDKSDVDNYCPLNPHRSCVIQA